jgi:drug/metabolite transporter (DMT)-like permease
MSFLSLDTLEVQSFSGDKTLRHQSIVMLHIAVFLFGFTAILGDLIQLKALYLVWWRVLITSVSLIFILSILKISFFVSKKDLFVFFGIGFLIGIHWLCFYGSVKLSNASFTLICMATTSFFTSIMEPLLFKRKINRTELILGMLMMPCMYLIVGNESKYSTFGIVVGLLSAFFAALFTVLNKKYIVGHNTLKVSLYEMIGVFILMSLILPFFGNVYLEILPSSSDWFYLWILSLLCTTLAWVISLKALKNVTAFESNVIVNLEPVYGIVLAVLILKEHKELNVNFYIGAITILLITILFPLMKKRENITVQST